MPEVVITSTDSRENAHKVGFLANEFPTKNIREIAGMCQMSPLEFNVAVWRCVDMGFFTVDNKKGDTTFDTLPNKWVFGKVVDDLIQAIPYALSRLAKEEGDMEENYLGNWASGGQARAHDVLIALRWLLNEGVIANYKIENTTIVEPSKKGKKRGKRSKKVVDTYTFFTLAENEKHHWGLKQFQDPARVKVVEK